MGDAHDPNVVDLTANESLEEHTVATNEHQLSAAVNVCCICLEQVDYQGSALVECGRCHMIVHVKCYGVSIPTVVSETWQCEPCQFLTKQQEASHVALMPPHCVICPIAGGALRRTTQPGAWVHVLCVNWIPELSHTSWTGAMDVPLDISVLDKSRESLRCLVCGQRGGCIQCVSGRCARAFHVICAIRSPSNLIFTGYNNDNQQVYHCKMHLMDIATRKFEMVDQSWKQSPRMVQHLASHPPLDGKCRHCANKIPAKELDRHEALCLLQWLTKEDVKERQQLMQKRGLKPIAIAYGANRDAGTTDSNEQPPSNNTEVLSSARKKRQHASMKPCRECGELVRETLMLGHLKKRCPQNKDTNRRAKNPKNTFKRKHSSSSTTSTAVIDLTDGAPAGSKAPPDQASDLSDVLFATWPGINAGNLMDSTHFWKIVNSHFFHGKNLGRRRVDQTCKTLCGARLDDVGNFAAKPNAQDWNCSDTAVLERKPPSDGLTVQSVLHRCDFMMRSSRIRCVEDLDAKPLIEIEHRRRPTVEANGVPLPQEDDCTRRINVLFQSTENKAIDCQYAMHMGRNGSSHKRPLPDGAVWSRFQHNNDVYLAGPAIQDLAVPDSLWVALEQCTDLMVPSSGFEDQLTPEINLLMDQLKEQMRLNRYRLRPLCQKLQLVDHAERDFHQAATITDSYYKEFTWWKRLCTCLTTGFRDPNAPKTTEELQANDKDDDENDEDDQEPVDDGTCVVCFDGQSPESNPIIFCDRCDLAVHQRCYGIVEVPNGDFHCDRCRAEDRGEDPATSVFCQLCPLRDGAFKQTVDGKWVHVVCALWCPGVWIGNLLTLSEISLVAGANPPRFVNSLAEIKARISGNTTATPPPHDPSVANHLNPLAKPLVQGSLCVFCRVACGRTIQCCASEASCTTSFHPLCAWYHGLFMTVERVHPGFIYGGSGTGLHFKVYCQLHFPASYSDQDYAVQAKRRTRFRIDSFFTTQSKRERLSLSTAEESEEETMEGLVDQEVCGACFELSSPVISDTAIVDIDRLNMRQFLLRCQYCNVFIHPACCNTELEDDAPSELYSSNWICERCTSTASRQSKATLPPCVLCDQSNDYMMPCSDNPSAGPTPPPELSTNTNFMLQNGSHHHQLVQQLKQLQHPSQSSSKQWLHVFCSKWSKAKLVRRNGTLCAQTPSGSKQTTAVRCDLCTRRGMHLTECEICRKRFHPICAARRKCFYTKSAKHDWKFWCWQHPPPSTDVAFDPVRQTWITYETLRHLQHVRRGLERARLIIEMVRQRDRERRRFFNLCSFPYLQASIDMIVRAEPTTASQQVYQHLTGENLEAPPPKKVKSIKEENNRRSSRRQSSDMDIVEIKSESDEADDEEQEVEIAPENVTIQTPAQLRRRRTSARQTEPPKRPAPSSASSSRRSKRIKTEEPEDPVDEEGITEEEEEEEFQPRRSTRRSHSVKEEPQLKHEANQTTESDRPSVKTKFLQWITTHAAQEDFDEVVPQAYPTMVQEYD